VQVEKPNSATTNSSSKEFLAVVDVEKKGGGQEEGQAAGKKGAVDYIIYESQGSHSNSNISSLKSVRSVTSQTPVHACSSLMAPSRGASPPISVSTQTAVPGLPTPLPPSLASMSEMQTVDAMDNLPLCNCHLADEEEQWVPKGYGSIGGSTSAPLVERQSSRTSQQSMPPPMDRDNCVGGRGPKRFELYQGETFVLNDRSFLI